MLNTSCYPDYTKLPAFKKRFDSVATPLYEDFSMDFFVTQGDYAKGYKPEAAAAICGNTTQESQFNPDIQGDKHIVGGSNGINQWNDGPKHDTKNGRYSKMKQFVLEYFKTKASSDKLEPPTSYEWLTPQQKFFGQLLYTDYEIRTPQYKAAYKALKTDYSNPNLAAIYGHIYEGFGDNSGAKRDAYAAKCLAKYKLRHDLNQTNSNNNGQALAKVGMINSKNNIKDDNFKSVKSFETKMGLRISPVAYTKEEFKAFVDKLDLNKMQWKPQFAVLHNTAAPNLKQWSNYGPVLQKKWPSNLNNYYSNLGWHSSVHLVCTPDYIWNLCNLLQDGVHASCFNKVSFGIEMVGDFSTESFDTGLGLLVQENAIYCLAVLFNKFKWDPSKLVTGKTGLHFHKMCKNDRHDCPGKNVDWTRVVAKVTAQMKLFKAAK